MKILFLPIDIEIPIIEISKITSSILKDGKYQPYWKSIDITDLNLPELNSVLDQLPFKKITNIYFKEQTKLAKPHYDVYPDMHFEENEYENILSNEPAGYRLVLIGKADKIYVKSQGRFKSAIVPTRPGCYVLNSTQALHMVNFDEGRKIIYIRGFLDSDKHQKLIEKSLVRYKDLAIIE